MKRWIAAAAALCLLTGCAPLLERSYSTAEPHSSKYWESEAAGTLRAENDQDIVNDLLILIGQHTGSATLRLYNFPDDQAAAEAMERAALEVQQETALGAYAAEYITYVSQSQRSCYEVDVQIGYRRSEEQIQTIVNATSFTALKDLLEAALDGGRAVRCALAQHLPLARAEEVSRRSSFAVCAALLLAGIILTFFRRAGLWPLGTAAYLTLRLLTLAKRTGE